MMARGKIPDRIRILRLLDGRDGLPSRQIKLALNLSDDRYNMVRDELLRDDLVEKYRCAGGGLRLTRKGKKFVAQSRASATEENEVESWTAGTGFVVSASGHVLTNAHVVEGFGWVQVCLEGEMPHLARVVARDSENDLALLETDYQPKTVPTFRRDVEVGEDVATYGFPLLDVLGKAGRFTVGTVSANIVGDNTSLLQIQAPVQPGNSGGALFDQAGNVVGVVVSGLDALDLAMAQGHIAQLVNFAIKSDIVLSFLNSNRVKISTSTDAPTHRPWPEVTSRARSFTVLIVCNAELTSSQPVPRGQVQPRDDTEMVERLRRAADEGVAAAQFDLGVMYANGDGVPQDEEEAAKWFRLAAEQGDADAQFALGVMYGSGRGVRQDDSEAVKWFRRAAEQGDANAQFALGVMCESGRGVRQDHSEALKWYRHAADQGNAEAQSAYENFKKRMPEGAKARTRGESKTTVRSVERSSEPMAGNRTKIGARITSLALELLKQHPDGIRNRDLVRQISQKDAQLNKNTIRSNVWNLHTKFPDKVCNVHGLFRLKKFHDKETGKVAQRDDNASKKKTPGRRRNEREGSGPRQDGSEEVTRLRRAAEEGDAAAQVNLGLMYDEGQGVPQDYTKAVEWYRRAAEQCYALGQYNLGAMYEEGQGVPQDDTEAAK